MRTFVGVYYRDGIAKRTYSRGGSGAHSRCVRNSAVSFLMLLRAAEAVFVQHCQYAIWSYLGGFVLCVVRGMHRSFQHGYSHRTILSQTVDVRLSDIFYCILACLCTQTRSVGILVGKYSPWTFPLTLIGMDSYFYYLRPNFCCVGEWFIGALLICYLLYPLLRKALHHLPYTTAVILVAGSCFIPFISWFTIEPWHNVWVCVTIFYLGMLLAQFPAVFTSKISFALSAILTLILFVVPLPFKQVGALSQIIYPILTGLACLVLLVHTGVYLERQERLKQGMTSLGKLSYPIFLVQQTTIQAVFSKWSALSLSEACTLLGMDILLTFLFAYIIITIHTELTHRHEKSIRHNA